jgi:acyl-CoA synthetase
VRACVRARLPICHPLYLATSSPVPDSEFGTLGCSDRHGGSAGATPRVVGVYASPSVEYIAAVLAVLRLGEAFLPLDPSWPEERVQSAVSASNAALVVSSGGSRAEAVFKSIACPVLRLDGDVRQWSGVGGVGIGGEELPWPCERERPREFCYVMFTSGSTGRPKGVCGTEKGTCSLWCAITNVVRVFCCSASEIEK